MKTLIHLFILILVSNVADAQNLLVANNNPGAASGINVFTGATALQDAITASTATDIIYIVPSAVNYGDATITIPLTLFGVGIRPDSESTNKSVLTNIIIDVSNVRISGLISTGEIRLGQNTSTGTTFSNILIENSRIRTVEMGFGNAELVNLLIRNNVFQGSTGFGGHIYLLTTSNTTITNNFFITNYTNGIGGMVEACCGALFEYNIFADNGNEAPYVVDNCKFFNNIFYGVRVDIASGSIDNTWNYNLSFGNTVDSYNVFNVSTNGNSGIGNIESTLAVPIDPLFINLPLTNIWTNSLDFTLTASSPALSTDAGNGSGEDMGTSGGATPFDFEGNLLPLIQSVTVPAVIPVGADLPVTIKAKGN